jgi:Amt family ammonium transporter
VDVSDVLAMADSACYVAKESGRNRFYVYGPDDETLLNRQGEMLWFQRVNAALDQDQFRLYLQPIVALDRDHAEPPIFEVLLRMVVDGHSVVRPESFLPAAERYQLMLKIDKWVIENTFKTLSHKLNVGKPPLRLSINLSAQSLLDDEFIAYIEHALQRYQIQGSRITFELTETAAIANFHRAVTLIHRLKAHGCRFALDDFGSGMCSFSYLKNLPVDMLKIDGDFVNNIVNDKKDLAMIKAISQLARAMGQRTVAEYVENESIINELRSLGIDYGQGYALGEPEPIEVFLRNVDKIELAG